MGSLTLVRHGQASFGAANYDQLSNLGELQSVRLGAYLAQQSHWFEAVYHGSLQRHHQTWAGIAAHLPIAEDAVYCRPGLNEFDGAALIRSQRLSAGEPGLIPTDYKAHFRALRNGLKAWMDGELTVPEMPTYASFRRGVLAVIEEIKNTHPDERVLVVSSGGPISTVIGAILETPAHKTIDINYQIYNTALTTFNVSASGLRLSSFNATPHLDPASDAGLFTYA
jgi:broad specificity phosphatase PhoE